MNDTKISNEDFDKIRGALRTADELVTMVISGKPGAIAKALEFARTLSELKRKGIGNLS